MSDLQDWRTKRGGEGIAARAIDAAARDRRRAVSAAPPAAENVQATSDREADLFDRRLGEAVRRERAAKKVEQGELAQCVGVSLRQVQKYERGTNRIATGRLLQIAAALGIDIAVLLAGIPAPHAKRACA